MDTVPADFPVRPIDDPATAKDPAQRGVCGRWWDDGVVTSMTPAPSGRCPFEYFHPSDRDIVAAAILTEQGWYDGDDPLEPESHDPCMYSAGAAEYLVLTEEEADARTADEIREMLWAFNADFLADYMPAGIDADEITAIRGDRSEDANPTMLALVGDRFDDLVAGAIAADGRGHFLAGYDSEELEHVHGGRYWYAYRVN